MSEILQRAISLDCSPAHAFSVFTEHVDLWWPPGHRRTRDSRLRFETGPNGRLLDVAPDGSVSTMATVTVFEPPLRLALDWYPGSPAAPTRVDVEFRAEAGGTTIRIEHRAPDAASSAVWSDRVETFAAGWDAVLSALGNWQAKQPGRDVP